MRFAGSGAFPLFLLAQGCASQPPAGPLPPSLTVTEVPEREVTEWDDFTGRLEAVDAVQIRPRASGYIHRVTFNEGNGVKRGQVPFEIDSRPYQALATAASLTVAEPAGKVANNTGNNIKVHSGNHRPVLRDRAQEHSWRTPPIGCGRVRSRFYRLHSVLSPSAGEWVVSPGT